MSIQEWLVVLNGLAVVLNIILVFQALNHNNLAGVLCFSFFLFLITGQSLNIAFNLIGNGSARYLHNHISVDGHLFATAFLLYTIVTLMVIEFFLFRHWLVVRFPINYLNPDQKKLSNIGYLLFMGIFGLIVLVLVKLVGVSAILNESRPGSAGATSMLIFLSVAQYPLNLKIVRLQKFNLLDLGLFGLSIVVSILFSRLLAIFYLLILICNFAYARIKSGKLILIKNLGRITGLTFLLGMLFFGVGTWRHFKGIPETAHLTFSQQMEFMMDHPELSLFAIDLNYKIGVEGISGLSGALSRYLENEEIKIDGGMSSFSGITGLFPSFVRTKAGIDKMHQSMREEYWYKGSVVGAGLENAYIHFSFLGLLLFPLALSLYYSFFHLKMMREKSGENILTNSIFLIFGLQIMRGQSWVFLTFLLAMLIVHIFCMTVLKFINNKRITL